MILSDTDQYIKDSLQTIISGRWNYSFSSYDINQLLHLSFILNHLDYNGDLFRFRYNDIEIDVTDFTISPDLSHFKQVISSIKSDCYYHKAFIQFKNTI